MTNKMRYLLFLLTVSSHIAFASSADVQEVPVVKNFQINKYLGTWYEIARIPNYFEKKCHSSIVAVYTLDKDGSVIVNNSCKKTDGVLTSSVGHAYFESDPNVGKLQVTFAPNWLSWMKLAYGDYWVIDTNYSSYALVGDSSRQYLWILSRTPQLNVQDMAKLTEEAKSIGYDLTDLIENK